MESQADERDPFHVVVGCGCGGGGRGLHDGGLGDVEPCTGLFHSAAAATQSVIFSQTKLLPRNLVRFYTVCTHTAKLYSTHIKTNHTGDVGPFFTF